MRLAGKISIGILPYLLYLLTGQVQAQREVMFDQYIESPLAINPAYTGMQEHFNMNIVLRRRWFSIQNAPITPTLYADGTVANGRIGLGFSALNDQMSPFSTTGFYGSTSYIHKTDSDWKFSVGAQGGINVLPVFGAGFSGRKILGSFGIGAWAENEVFYAGLSKPELLKMNFGTSGSSWAYELPVYLTTGGKIELDDDWVLVPNGTAVFYNNFKNEVHIGGKLWYARQISAGAYFRTGDINRFHFAAEAQIGQNVRVGYTFDSRTVESRYAVVGIGLSGMHQLVFRFVPNPASFRYF